MPYKICIVLVGKLPALPTKGGAVETLVMHLLDENEKDPQAEFTVLSIGDPQAMEQAKAYQHTKFVWFKPYRLWNKVWWRVRTLGLKLGAKEVLFPYQRIKGANWLKQHWQEFDCIVAESELEMIARAKIPPQKVLYHLHWAGKPCAERDGWFGTLIAVSDYVGQNWKKCTGRKEQSVRLLYNCVDVEKFHNDNAQADRQKLREMLGIPQDQFTLLYCGRIIPEKGVKELVQAMDLLKKPAALIVVGSVNFGLKEQTDYQRELTALAQQSRQKIILTGFIHNDQLPRYCAAADVSIVPSVWAEPAGLVEVEAMAAGLPVIATRSGGIPEYLGENCGRVLPVDDQLPQRLAEAIDELHADPELCRRMAEQGPIQAQKFNTRNYYQNFLAIVADHLAGNGEK